MAYSDLNKNEIDDLYHSNGLSTRKLALKFGVTQTAIMKFMQRNGITRRNRIEAVIMGCKLYDKKPFSGDINEKAYLSGVAFADFRRRMHGYQIDICLGTTHPYFSSLFRELFEKYAPVHENPYHNKYMNRYGWRLETQLHPSFDFLLAPRTVPDWVMQDNEAFLHFLAGYADGEGIFHIGRCSGRNISFIFAVSSEDKEILTSLLHGLESMGFHPTLRMLRAKGETNVLYGQVLTYGDDQFMLRLKRKSEVIRLLEILPIRHHEKIRKRDLMLSLRDKIHIEDVSELWIDLKNQIKNEVKIYVSKAESEFHLRRNSLIISSALE